MKHKYYDNKTKNVTLTTILYIPKGCTAADECQSDYACTVALKRKSVCGKISCICGKIKMRRESVVPKEYTP